MATDYTADDYVEAFTDSPPVEGDYGGFELELEGNLRDSAEGRGVDSMDANKDSAVANGLGVNEGDSNPTIGGDSVYGGIETLDSSHVENGENGSGRNGGRGKGGNVRAGRGRGSSKEAGSKPEQPRKRKQSSDTPSDGKAPKSRKKSEDTGNVEGRKKPVRNVAGELVRGERGGNESNVTTSSTGGQQQLRAPDNTVAKRVDNSQSVLGRQSIVKDGSVKKGDEIINTPEERQARYMANILSIQNEVKAKKAAGYQGRNRVDLIALGEEIRKVNGLKCHSLEAFLICNKEQLVCFGTFIDGEGKVSVGTMELIDNYKSILSARPNFDVEADEDTKRRLNRKWWKVPSHCHKKIVDAQNESVVQHSGEKLFTMTLTGYFKGSMIDNATGELRVTYSPNLVFMPYKVLLE